MTEEEIGATFIRLTQDYAAARHGRNRAITARENAQDAEKAAETAEREARNALDEFTCTVEDEALLAIELRRSATLAEPS